MVGQIMKGNFGADEPHLGASLTVAKPCPHGRHSAFRRELWPQHGAKVDCRDLSIALEIMGQRLSKISYFLRAEADPNWLTGVETCNPNDADKKYSTQ